MRFERQMRRGSPREAVVPMINVVFLLLIFFLMTATLAVPPPFEMTLPEGAGREDAMGADVLFLAADGSLAYGDSRGEAVFDALSTRDRQAPLDLRADAAVPASEVAALAVRLSAAGFENVRLVMAVAP